MRAGLALRGNRPSVARGCGGHLGTCAPPRRPWRVIAGSEDNPFVVAAPHRPKFVGPFSIRRPGLRREPRDQRPCHASSGVPWAGSEGNPFSPSRTPRKRFGPGRGSAPQRIRSPVSLKSAPGDGSGNGSVTTPGGTHLCGCFDPLCEGVRIRNNYSDADRPPSEAAAMLPVPPHVVSATGGRGPLPDL